MTAITQNFGSAGLKICDRENIFFGNASKVRGALSGAFSGAQIVPQKWTQFVPPELINFLPPKMVLGFKIWGHILVHFWGHILAHFWGHRLGLY